MDDLTVSIDSHNFVNELYIQKADSLGISFFKETYKQILKRICKIIDGNGSQPRIESWQEMQTISSVNNIIPVIGGRGTGKSSVLTSVINCLSDSIELEKWVKILLDNSNYSLKLSTSSFVCLNRIDADLLESGENMFEIVLAEMYKRFIQTSKMRNRRMDLGRIDEYEERELRNQFDQLFRAFQYLTRRGKNSIDISGIQSLYETSMSMSIRDDFTELVQKYMAYVSNRDGDAYLIITIDDIDMHIENSFEFMEQIHRYLMVPKVIVLLALDMEQFTHICNKHYLQICPNNAYLESFEDDIIYWKRYTSILTQNYLDKIFPIEDRVYLPELRNQNNEIQISGYKQGNSRKSASGKWVILYKIYRRSGIICDGLGKKRHYYEPDTLRKVIRLVKLLDDMDIVIRQEGRVRDITVEKKMLETNFQRLYKDVVEHMAREKLLEDDRKILDTISVQHSTRQNKVGYQELQKVIEENVYVDDFMPENRLIGSIDRLVNRKIKLENQYSYGDYIRAIYIYSKKIEKNLIHTLLALGSINMTKIANELDYKRMLNKKRDVEADLISVRQVYGERLTSSAWIDIILKKFIYTGKRFEFDPIDENPSFTLLLNTLEEVFIALYYVYMLFPGLNHIGVTRRRVEREYRYHLIINRVPRDIDLMGFVLGTLNHEEVLAKTYRDITKVPYRETREKQFTDLYNSWFKRYKTSYAIPVYSLDLYYNLIKRLYELDLDKNPDLAKDCENLFRKFDKDRKNNMAEFEYAGVAYLCFLEAVRYLLKQQDEFYNKSAEEKVMHLGDIFFETPAIRMLYNENGELDHNKTECRILIQILGNCLKLIT